MLRVLQRKPKPAGVMATIEGSPHQMPPVEFAWVQELYREAKTILEYGSGKSTLFAAGLPGRTVFSVETDGVWIAALERHFETEGSAADLRFHHGDIGPTREWGNPATDEGWRSYHLYPLSVWDRPDFEHPDVVLIDGRFRAACWMTVLFRIERPTTVLFDDYTNREAYHVVERYAAPTERRGRMARFELTPRAVPARDLAQIVDLYHRPF